MKVIQFNCNSVRSKLEAIRELVRRHQPHVLLLQETKLERHEVTPRFDGFEAVRQDAATADFAASRGVN